ncbi:SAP30-binding protein, partial [Mucuna pruriens]
MTSKKKHSEGIALLSMYNDDGDDEMEDVEEEEGDAEMRTEEDAVGDARYAREEDFTDRTAVVDSGNEVADEGFTPVEKNRFGASTPQMNTLVSPPPEQARIGRKGALTIVDYGHDEVAMSPEPEEGEIYGSGRVMFGDQLHVTNGDLLDRTPLGTVQVLTPSNQANTPQFSEPLKSDTTNNDAVIRSDDAELGEADQDDQRYIDPLDKFLPPPPKAKCSEELQRKINKFLEYKKAGKSFNAEVRNRKDYRNPDFLLHAVRYQDIDQIGSCFSKDVFDPHGYDSSDFYDEIEADMRRESERKEQEKKKAQKVEFISGVTQPGIAASVPRISMSVAGASAVTASGLPLAPPTADTINRDGRQNKKSKWDKVDGDRKNPLPSAGQDSVSTIGAHAAILSAANAGGGYMLFAQQKRREAEEKRSSER